MMFFLLDSKGQGVGNCFRFERGKCLDYGFVFVFECLKVLKIFSPQPLDVCPAPLNMLWSLLFIGKAWLRFWRENETI